jgi:hypothetical protein
MNATFPVTSLSLSGAGIFPGSFESGAGVRYCFRKQVFSCSS